jgi:hypothetical protein
MALTDGLVGKLTLKMLDVFTSIFLAILFFSCTNQAMKTFRVADMFPGAVELFSFLQLVALYLIAIGVAYLYRDNTLVLVTFCSCGAHYIAFTGIGGGSVGQKNIVHIFGEDFGIVGAFGFCVVVAAMLIVIGVIGHILWRKGLMHKKLHESIDEMELDIVGLVLSFLITQAVQHALTGHYPAAHLFLQGHHITHTPFQRAFMLCWSIGLTIVAAVALPRLKHFAHHFAHAKWVTSVIHILKVVIIMLVAWGYLLWGQWTFYEDILVGQDPMFAHMVFAMIATLAALLVLFLLGHLWESIEAAQAQAEAPATAGPTASTSSLLKRMATSSLSLVSSKAAKKEMRQTFNIMVTGISLVAAWSWEHCFAMAFDVIGQEYQVGYEGLVPKLVLAVILPIFLLPTYVIHIKNRVIEAEEENESGSEASES